MIDPILLVLLLAGVFVFINGMALSKSRSSVNWSDLGKQNAEICKQIHLDMERLLEERKNLTKSN